MSLKHEVFEHETMREFQVFCCIHIYDRLDVFRCKFKQWNQEI